MSPRKTRSKPTERRLARLNWMEMGEWVPAEIDTVLVPVGTLEAHGILSLGTDNEIPSRLGEAVAARVNALVAPAIPYGVTASLGALAGGTHIPAAPFTEYAAAVFTTLTHQGFRNVIALNGHLPRENRPLLRLPEVRALQVFIGHGIANSVVPTSMVRADRRLFLAHHHRRARTRAQDRPGCCQPDDPAPYDDDVGTFHPASCRRRSRAPPRRCRQAVCP